VESIGIKKTFEKIEQAQVVLYLFEGFRFQVSGSSYITEIEKVKNKYPLKPLLVVINKIDLLTEAEIAGIRAQLAPLNVTLETISAKANLGIDALKTNCSPL